MADIHLQFTGRFVYADPVNAAPANRMLHVLGVNVAHAGGVPHRPLLAAALKHVSRSETTLTPTLVVAQPNTAPNDTPLAIWDVTGARVEVEAAGGYVWATSPTVPGGGATLGDLNSLAPGATLDPTALQHIGSGERVASLFKVGAGTGRLDLIDPRPARFEPLATAGTGTSPFDLRLAEVLEVTLSLPGATPTLRLRITDESGRQSVVAFISHQAASTTVTVSSLCAGEPADVDEEFADIYDILDQPPLRHNRQVPVIGPSVGRAFPCFRGGYVRIP